jgi:hypothetical protein
MTRPTRRLGLVLALVFAGVAAAGVARAALRPTTALELTNAARGRALTIPIVPGEPFSVTYHHSMYEQPVTEEFVVGPEGEIVLQAVSSPSAAVREYFGITAPGERHPVVRAMPEIVFRVAAGTPQRLSVRGVERSFLELGERGDRLVLRAILLGGRGEAPPQTVEAAPPAP